MREGLGRVEVSQREILAKLDGVESAVRALNEAQRETTEQTAAVGRHFDTFLVRFDETLQMLVAHDTDQFQRVAAVERENAALRQEYVEILRRLEAVERRLAS